MGVGGWQKPVLGGKAPLGCFGLGRGSRGREWANVKKALPNQPPHAYFILSLSKFYEHLVLAPKSILLRDFFLIYLSLTTSRICYNSFFLPFPLLILPGLALHRQSRADPGSSPAPRAAHKPRVTWSGCSWILFPKGEFIQECLCYLKTLSHPFKARANGGAGFGSAEQTGEEKGRERWEWERRASFVCYFPTKQKLYEYLDELLDTSSHLLLKKIFLFVESVIFLDA